VNPTSIGVAGEATVSVEVANTGSREGNGVAELYIHQASPRLGAR
jgi:hypothetical protein